MIWIAVAVAGGIGASLRYIISMMMSWKASEGFPWATLLINLLGSSLLMWLFLLYKDGFVTEMIWNIVGVGGLGAFTTFSTFSYEWLQLVLHKRLGAAAGYLIATIIGCIFAGVLVYQCYSA